MRRGTRRSAALLLALPLLLAACTAPAEPDPPEPLADDERIAAFEEMLDRDWNNWVGQMHPDLPQPETRVVRVIDADEWMEVTAACMTEAGFTATIGNGGLTLESGIDGQDEDLQLAQFICHAQYPSHEMLESLLSDDELGALYDYYIGFLQPCLANAGQPISQAPTREEFVKNQVWWHPYETVWRDGTGESLMSYLERRCPSEPAWRSARW